MCQGWNSPRQRFLGPVRWVRGPDEWIHRNRLRLEHPQHPSRSLSHPEAGSMQWAADGFHWWVAHVMISALWHCRLSLRLKCVMILWYRRLSVVPAIQNVTLTGFSCVILYSDITGAVHEFRLVLSNCTLPFFLFFCKSWNFNPFLPTRNFAWNLCIASKKVQLDLLWQFAVIRGANAWTLRLLLNRRMPVHYAVCRPNISSTPTGSSEVNGDASINILNPASNHRIGGKMSSRANSRLLFIL